MDFEIFEVSPQELTGDCSDQSLTIEGVATSFCNTNTGQHVYLNIHSVPATRDIDFTAIRGSPYKYSLKISQIDCNTNEQVMRDIQAPVGCLQYFREPSGTIQSFNYDGVRAYATNQDYAICIARSDKNCGIKYTNPPLDTSRARSVGAAFQQGCSAGGSYGGTQDSGCGEDCMRAGIGEGVAGGDSDWLTIAGGQLADADLTAASSYKAFFCGRGLGVDTNYTTDGVDGKGVVDFSSGPFIIKFHADGIKPQPVDDAITDDVGFVVEYAVQTGTC